jgi:predicted DNA-binding transcriptional regulator AlpA
MAVHPVAKSSTVSGSRSAAERLRLTPAARLGRGIPAATPGGQPIFLTVSEVAALLRLSVITICRWRISGTGPPFRKFGRRVVYGRADILAWAAEQKRLSTSDRR